MVYLGSDHRGFALKEKIKQWLSDWNYQYEDCGAFSYDKDDDYPDFVHKAARAVANDPEQNRGIILGGSGQGEAMVANRYKGVRAAVFYGPPFQFSILSKKKWLLIFGAGGATGVFEKMQLDTVEQLIRLSREHNNANVLSLGASFMNYESAKKIIKLWLDTSFSNEIRNKRRVEKIDEM